MQNSNLLINMRNKKGLTQSDLAKFLNVSLKTYQSYEQGINPIKLEELNKLSNFYYLTFNTLLGLSKSQNFYNTEINIDYKYLKFSLRYIRKIARITIANLAKTFKISASSIMKYEHDPKTVSIPYLYAFAKYFNVSLDYICGKTLKKEVF